MQLSHSREIVCTFSMRAARFSPKSDERKSADGFPLSVNLPLSTYSFFLQNFLFAFRSSERATAKALCTAVARNANVRALTVLGNQVEICN